MKRKVDISGGFGFNSPAVTRIVLALVIAAAVGCAVAPAAEELETIAPGVTLLGTSLGGLNVHAAEQRVTAIANRPLTIWYRGQQLTVQPSRLGAQADVGRAVEAAFAATRPRRLALHTGYDPDAVSNYVLALAARFDREPRGSRVVGAGPKGPLLTPERLGIAVETNALAAALEEQLASGTRDPLVLPVAILQPQRTVGAVVVVDRAANRLRLYDRTRLVRTFPVATGQSIYPTPSGIFSIVVKERDPWWYPPTYDSWAKGLKPVPPGPENPLGTRWMGLSVPGVGIHGTDEPTSIGYSESHGCVRMQVPDAEWLFGHVRVGTPVVIL
jgi:lipoprotein-anchoring transpeptidase ErfK/SrfK